MKFKPFLTLITLLILFNFSLSAEDEEKFEYDPKLEIKINSNPSKELVETASKWSSFLRNVGEFYFQFRKGQKAYVYEGHGEIRTPSKTWKFKTGDYIEFPKNFTCIYKIEKFLKVRFLWDKDEDEEEDKENEYKIENEKKEKEKEKENEKKEKEKKENEKKEKEKEKNNDL